MLEVHKGFYSDLSQACANDKRTTSEKPRIHEVFLKWKPHLLLYGDYCSNLPKAQETIEKLTKTNEAVKLKVEVGFNKTFYRDFHINGSLFLAKMQYRKKVSALVSKCGLHRLI